jgi:hypothetical protein
MEIAVDITTRGSDSGGRDHPRKEIDRRLRQGIEVLNDRPAQWQATDWATDSQKFANTPNRKQLLNAPEQGIGLFLRPDRRVFSADPADSTPTSSAVILFCSAPLVKNPAPLQQKSRSVILILLKLPLTLRELLHFPNSTPHNSPRFAADRKRSRA